MDPIQSYVLGWLRDERDYQVEKFDLDDDDRHTMAEDGTAWWETQFDNYLQRVALMGLDNPNGRQALAKFVATACGYLESAVRVYGPLPEPGVSSGNNLDKLRPLP